MAILGGGVYLLWAMIMQPLCVSLYLSICSIFIGRIRYFDELSDFSTLQAVMFPTGVVLTIIGVFILTQRDDSTDAADANKHESKGQHTASSTGLAEGSGTGSNDTQLQRTSSMPSTPLDSTPTATEYRRRLDRTHVSQMSLRPSLALSVAGSMGSISTTLKAALKFAGELADRGGESVLQSGSVSTAELSTGSTHLEGELRQQAVSQSSGSLSSLRSPGSRLGDRDLSARSGFASLHSLNEHSLSASLKVSS